MRGGTRVDPVVAYDRLPIGVLSASRQYTDSSVQQVDTTRIELRRNPVGGILVRYIQSEQTARDRLLSGVSPKQMQVEIPGWIARDLRNRLDVGAVRTEKPRPGEPPVSSTMNGRFDVVSHVGMFDVKRQPFEVVKLVAAGTRNG